MYVESCCVISKYCCKKRPERLLKTNLTAWLRAFCVIYKVFQAWFKSAMYFYSISLAVSFILRQSSKLKPKSSAAVNGQGDKAQFSWGGYWNCELGRPFFLSSLDSARATSLVTANLLHVLARLCAPAKSCVCLTWVEMCTQVLQRWDYEQVLSVLFPYVFVFCILSVSGLSEKDITVGKGQWFCWPR